MLLYGYALEIGRRFHVQFDDVLAYRTPYLFCLFGSLLCTVFLGL